MMKHQNQKSSFQLSVNVFLFHITVYLTFSSTSQVYWNSICGWTTFSPPKHYNLAPRVPSQTEETRLIPEQSNNYSIITGCQVQQLRWETVLWLYFAPRADSPIDSFHTPLHQCVSSRLRSLSLVTALMLPSGLISSPSERSGWTWCALTHTTPRHTHTVCLQASQGWHGVCACVYSCLYSPLRNIKSVTSFICKVVRVDL